MYLQRFMMRRYERTALSAPDALRGGRLREQQSGKTGGKRFLTSLLEQRCSALRGAAVCFFAMESLILAQNERWRHGLGMQVERTVFRKRDGQWRKGE